jgi:hypothetical protein
MSSVLNLILCHQSPQAVGKMVKHWQQCVPTESILIAYGGPRAEFDTIEHKQKFFVDDSRLRTLDHQREFQSYTRMFQKAAEFLADSTSPFRFLYFAEYDHIPLAADLNERQCARLREEGADVLAFHLARVDDTSNPHFLYHAANSEFAAHWRRISVRTQSEVVLSMFGSGSFWTSEALCAVAAVEEPFAMYMEIYLPTLAHHLGFRLRDLPDQNRFVRATENEIVDLAHARKQDAWTLHPIKRLWE